MSLTLLSPSATSNTGFWGLAQHRIYSMCKCALTSTQSADNLNSPFSLDLPLRFFNFYTLTLRLHYDIVTVIICKTIGEILMSQSNLEKQEAKLKQLNPKIKEEKYKIEQRLGKQIISQANLEYTNLSNDQIKLLAKQFSEFLKEKTVDH